MTWQREQFLTEVAETGIISQSYAEDLLVRLAHNSAAIEGNTLSLADTFTLLVDARTPARSTTLRELYEVANHREALVLVLRSVSDDAPLSTGLVRAIHGALLDHLTWDTGQWKTSENLVVGADFTPTPPSQVASRMAQWADQAEWQTANLDGGPLLEAIAAAHIDFERIHPFSDGNGRVGRAIIAFQTIRRFGAPAIIPVTRRAEYLAALVARDAPALQHLLAGALAHELARASGHREVTRVPPRQ